MDIKEFDYINQCIELKNDVFYYYKDKYVLDMLLWYIGRGMHVSSVKSSYISGMLDKPVMKRIMKHLPTSILRDQDLLNYWPADFQAFKISFGRWKNIWSGNSNNWGQTSRSGINLVLRLDFAKSHDRIYQNLIRPVMQKHKIFENTGHPINTDAKTLAWARMDIDLDNGEVLIEEIQNDWLRYADRLYKEVSSDCIKGKVERSDNWFFERTSTTFTRFGVYFNEVLEPYRLIWDEAVLSAAIHFIRNELGIKRIYYNSWETGNIMKNMSRNWYPPRSLYTKLPKRFGFRLTTKEPRMLKPRVSTMRKSGNDYEWFLMEV
jgi:hypothetical protein